ncbi:Pre-rRNA-processing protein TSR2, putative [Perkinsus marinus ATCC 50983]|uniref:Pre-rRNA-processing protein TSR2, putative n=1 Tax=Perkinsus marinus (strain ATCC 50983 / TXsc) TaxID=423536 RepID=C5L1S1_PERM5|nr:Pre-rRNA-processing protein TSR2, putative [Perkinsus marinus ATCC 50983]EER09320.1 Pre-rRNA-processing protein TSR2, putative [Perkinsus marinus ATCC 50983]|eukprot:XP_002777504.1 Pre-rRNA-processing protein TSR2, putative [Perkinsus marinus ATCC 50983]
MPSSTECEQAFLEAVHHVFTSWTALTLVKENCDCNPREASQRIESIADTVVADLRAGGAKLSSENNDQVLKLADKLFEMIANNFQMVLEDGSDEDVAYMLIRLWESCSRGDLSVAREVVNATQNRDQSKVLEQCAEEGQEESSEGDGDEEQEEGPEQDRQESKKEPEVDEDGFQTVTRGRRRR